MRTRSAARFRSRYGPWALVAGGSDGIGAELARLLAQMGLNIVVVGRREAPLRSLADELEELWSIETLALPHDLSERDQIRMLLEETEELEIGLLVCNAAVSEIGLFLDQPIDSHEQMVDLNVRMPLLLVHELGRRMRGMRRGGIILLSSMAALQGTVLSVHYAATKAYVRLLAEGLWAELRPFGIDVTASCPGTVDTPTFRRDGPVSKPGATLPVIGARPVAAQTIRALGRRPVVVPGTMDRIAAFFMHRLLPRKSLIRLTERSMRVMYPRDGRGDGSGAYRTERHEEQR